MCRQSDDLHRQLHLLRPTRLLAAEPPAPDLRLAAIEYLAEKDLSMTSSKQRLGVVGLGARFVALSGYAGLLAACTVAVK